MVATVRLVIDQDPQLLEKDHQVLQVQEHLMLSNKEFDELLAACAEYSEPSKGLLEAARVTDELGIR